jgi:uncharacterized protein
MKLNGAVGIVTGASRGIGVFIAEQLARNGVNLALAARSEGDLQATKEKVERFGVDVVAIPTDVNKRTDLKTLVKRTTDELGPPDILVNNAGIERVVEFARMDFSDIDAIIKTNVGALVSLTRLVVPGMAGRRRGHIVNIASLAGKTAAPYQTVYSASKHAVVGFSWSLREELRPSGVGVSVVCPGYVSEAGMFADRPSGEAPPKITGTVTPQQVADATIKAIEKNRAEIIVAPGLAKVVDVTHAISPELTTTFARRTGAYAYIARAAKRARKAD